MRASKRGPATPPIQALLTEAIRAANREVGGSVLELAEAEYMVRTRGYIQSLEDIETIPIEVSATGTPILLRDLARVQIGPEMRASSPTSTARARSPAASS